MYDFRSIYQAKDVADAIAALQRDPEAVLIAGGTDVLIKIREGKLAGCSLVSIHELRELSGVTMEEDGTLSIGALTTFHDVTYDPLVQKHLPVLGEAVDQAGGPTRA